MDALTQSDSLREEDRALRRQLGFSEFYKGDIHNTKNQQAETADYENASLFLTNLPLFYSERKLILALLPHGPFDRIYATSVTPPGVGHNGSSAKVVTFTRRGAERLYAFIVSGQFIVDGRRVRCVWNSIKQRAPNAAQYLSRVMIIRVQKAVLDEKRLIKLLNHNLVYQLEQDPKFTPAQDDSDITQIEVRFCSFRAQAEAFRILLASEVPEAKVRFGIDPLADDPKHSANNPTVDKWAQLGRFRRGG
ncbi:hypothetical protein B0T21DRAFT_298680 [Apiosordaria backusii]|uniref:Uncharacterized protein n=1 Tax=Apiosordaria backusii TaxID=314023 RepID=A0AA40A0Y5_9PEZI|nr:hypothetical protein B0T21DRAFT_298680 [Apiosordaria backusii]